MNNIFEFLMCELGTCFIFLYYIYKRALNLHRYDFTLNLNLSEYTSIELISNEKKKEILRKT